MSELLHRYSEIQERTIESAMSRGGMITRPGVRTTKVLVDGSDCPFKLLAFWGMLQLEKHLVSKGRTLSEWAKT